MLISKLLLLSFVSLATTDMQVLFFTMDSCPPCKQTEPGIEQLRREGVAVSTINIVQHQGYAQQCRVDRTPTVMVINGNQVLARHTGALNYDSLRQMVTKSQAMITEPSNVQQPASKSADSPNQAADVEGAPAASPTEVNTKSLTPQERAMAASVRFRVEDQQGVSLATGTIIHRRENEALVLTCGHVFRDSAGRGKINAEIGIVQGEQTTVVGKLMYYDAEDHDIALVAIPCPLAIEPVPVAPEVLRVHSGDKIFSVGCDRGADPSLRSSVLKSVTTYSGVKKYDIVGRPIDGRSGGGLFSAGGQLIGVCNAAAVEVDEGIYTGLQSVYWQFAKTNLTHLFEESAGRRQVAANSPTPGLSGQVSDRGNTTPSSLGKLDHPAQRTSNVVARTNEMAPPASQPVYRGGGVPINSAVYRGKTMPVRTASSQTVDEMEMIVILRSKKDPERNETFTIDQPSAQTLEWLKANEPMNRSRLANLPELSPPQSRNQAELRAQSPR